MFQGSSKAGFGGLCGLVRLRSKRGNGRLALINAPYSGGGKGFHGICQSPLLKVTEISS